VTFLQDESRSHECFSERRGCASTVIRTLFQASASWRLDALLWPAPSAKCILSVKYRFNAFGIYVPSSFSITCLMWAPMFCQNLASQTAGKQIHVPNHWVVLHPASIRMTGVWLREVNEIWIVHVFGLGSPDVMWCDDIIHATGQSLAGVSRGLSLYMYYIASYLCRLCGWTRVMHVFQLWTQNKGQNKVWDE